ncbi:unnamed protein product [Spirodela intermedia]|uniref:Calcineurin-like phosphoesterase domain-containing protein n=1 Tax=Spirodela intermedia TaxID=51605 RepID=A0A7I8KVT3_SPIIN|nr:unnamed protein product [Spirodela intermedia]
MLSLSRLTLLLCCAWAGTLLYGEMFTYWLPFWTCSWPHGEFSSSIMGIKQNPDDRLNVAVLADPQLMDRTSLGLPPESMVLEAAKFYTDLYMRRSFLSSILPFKPDIVLFLGDQFDGGPLLSDQEWKESLNRFKHIFYLKERGRDADIKLYYLSGNHDIGYSGLHSHHPEVISRFEKDFGLRNYRFSVQKVDFIVIDAQTLDGPTKGNFTSLTWDFIKNISKDPSPNSRVLLTHIPLHRPDGTPCGPHRVSPIINQRVSHAGPDQGITYQNYLTEKTSEKLLELIKPMLVLSGHDHDQCSVTHSTSFGPVVEHTLGTVSWQQGNLYPSFMLLSVFAPAVINTTQGHQVSTSLCFLPRQTHIYIWYLCLFAVTILMVSFWPSSGVGCWDRFVQVISSFITTTKEKNEDEDCEYEMVWDAEGSMHLVKKATPKALASSSNDTGLMGRGNAIARPAAKKYLRQEAEPSFAVDMSTDVKSAETCSGKSRAGRAAQRLVRILRLLLIIATVNVPLYIMLLFKDWI